MRLQGVTDDIVRKIAQVQVQEDQAHDVDAEAMFIYDEMKSFLESKFAELQAEDPQRASQIINEFIETYIKDGWLARDFEMRY